MSKIKAGILCFLLLTTLGSKTYASELRVVFSDWCPYMCLDKDNIGYAVEILQLTLLEMDVEVRMLKQPYYKAIQMLKSGEADAIPAMYDYDLQDITAADIQVGQQVNQYYIVSGTDWYYTNPVSLEKVGKLGVLGGKSYEPVVELFKRKNRESVLTVAKGEGTTGLINALLKNEVTAILHDANAIAYYQSKVPGAEDISLVGSMRNPEKLVIGFSNKMPNQSEFLTKFNQELQKMRESGRFQAVLQKYHIKDWQ